MDTKDKDKSDLEKTNEEPLNYHSLGLSSDWRYDIPNFTNSSMNLVSNGNSMPISSSMVDSFGPVSWENPNITAPLGFSELNVHNSGGISDPLSILKGGLFLPNMSGILPNSLSQFPADSGFIERAARFSSFSGGHFGNLLDPMGIHSPFVQSGVMIQGSQELSSGNVMKTRHNEKLEVLKDVSLNTECVGVERKSPQNEPSIDRLNDEAKREVSVLGNESDEPEFSGGGARDEPVKDVGTKKRKRVNQDVESEQNNANQEQSNEAKNNDSDNQQKGEQNSTPNSNKSNGKKGKQSSQTSDSPKEEYIHVRARRGQATNSHSLAERVRREKISERMKFLQDLVPGCSKVTGKAVMLDEIINYVQSLQRQVEFLSMKLATVNPRLNFNVDRLFTKEMMSARGGPSSGLAFSPEIQMAYPPLHQSQPPILPPGTGNSCDLLRGISLQLPNMGESKDASQQLPSMWEGELHNIVHMGFNANVPIDNQETNCSLPHEQTKAES